MERLCAARARWKQLRDYVRTIIEEATQRWRGSIGRLNLSIALLSGVVLLPITQPWEAGGTRWLLVLLWPPVAVALLLFIWHLSLTPLRLWVGQGRVIRALQEQLEKRRQLDELAAEGEMVKRRIGRTKMQSGEWEHDPVIKEWVERTATYLRENLGEEAERTFISSEEGPRWVTHYPQAPHEELYREPSENLVPTWGYVQMRINALRYLAQELENELIHSRSTTSP